MTSTRIIKERGNADEVKEKQERERERKGARRERDWLHRRQTKKRERSREGTLATSTETVSETPAPICADPFREDTITSE